MLEIAEKIFRRCPSCKKLFDAVKEKQEVLGAYEVQEHTRSGGVKELHVENISYFQM
jgi:hypothetical protein